jgi:hypothetical protein
MTVNLLNIIKSSIHVYVRFIFFMLALKFYTYYFEDFCSEFADNSVRHHKLNLI